MLQLVKSGHCFQKSDYKFDLLLVKTDKNEHYGGEGVCTYIAAVKMNDFWSVLTLMKSIFAIQKLKLKIHFKPIYRHNVLQ